MKDEHQELEQSHKVDFVTVVLYSALYRSHPNSWFCQKAKLKYKTMVNHALLFRTWVQYSAVLNWVFDFLTQMFQLGKYNFPIDYFCKEWTLNKRSCFLARWSRMGLNRILQKCILFWTDITPKNQTQNKPKNELVCKSNVLYCEYWNKNINQVTTELS